jgi:SOS-response transcriptional repressor LexA
MTVKLTKKQLAVLDFLRDFTEEKGCSPSYREMMVGLGLSSVSAVAEHVENLVGKGVLKKVPGAARSLEILDYKHEETVELFKKQMIMADEEEKKILEKAAEILGLDLGEE